MKSFEMPKMTVVRLTKEDIVRTSLCSGFTCDECAKCEGSYYCDLFDCYSAYNG